MNNGADRAGLQHPPGPGERLEKTGAGGLAEDFPAAAGWPDAGGRRREGRVVQADPPVEGGIGLAKKRGWPARLRSNGDGSSAIIAQNRQPTASSRSEAQKLSKHCLRDGTVTAPVVPHLGWPFTKIRNHGDCDACRTTAVRLWYIYGCNANSKGDFGLRISSTCEQCCSGGPCQFTPV